MGHSLGGASLLIYAVMQRRKKLPHYITRLVLLTPAGFLKTNPIPWVPPSSCLLLPPIDTPETTSFAAWQDFITNDRLMLNVCLASREGQVLLTGTD